MKSIIKKIIDGEELERILSETIDHIFTYGPIYISDLEILTYMKIYQPELFAQQEKSILMIMGLFFKNVGVNSFRDVIFDIYKLNIQSEYSGNYTPISMQ